MFHLSSNCFNFLNYNRWKINARKKALNSGKPTRNRNGRFVPARVTGPDCGYKLECFQNVDEEERKRILESFNGLADYNLQNIYLRGLIDSREIRRVGAQGMYGKADGEKNQKRKCSYEYWIHTKEQRRVTVTTRKKIIVN